MSSSRDVELHDFDREPLEPESKSPFSWRQIPRKWIIIAVVIYVASILLVALLTGLLAGLLPNRTEQIIIAETTTGKTSTSISTQASTSTRTVPPATSVTTKGSTSTISSTTHETTTTTKGSTSTTTSATTKATTPDPSGCIGDECNPRLSTDLIVHKYEIIYEINSMNQTLIRGQVTINFRLKQPLKQIIYHAKDMVYLETPSLYEDGVNRLVSMRFFPLNDYISLTPKEAESFPTNEYQLVQSFIISVSPASTGILRTDFVDDDEISKQIFSTKLKPTYARRAFPCFDEPQLLSTFSITIRHPTDTFAISNTIPASELVNDDSIETVFSSTFPMSTYLVAWAVLPDSLEQKEISNLGYLYIVWARSGSIESNQTDFALNNIGSVLEDIGVFLDDNEPVPSTITLLGLPSTTIGESENWGLIILQEDRLFANEETSSAIELQTHGETLSRLINHYWFGNYVAMQWWNDFWFQEAAARWYSLRSMDLIFPDWNILPQYLTHFHIPAMWLDSRPSSHPISVSNIARSEEINLMFDPLTVLKGTAFLKSLESIVGYQNLQSALKQYFQIYGADVGNLTAFYDSLPLSITGSEYVKNWIEQANYPLVSVSLTVENGNTKLDFVQSRFIISNLLNISGLDNNYRWKINMECMLGGHFPDDDIVDAGTETIKFFFDQETYTQTINQKTYSWIKCNKDFKSILVTQYRFSGAIWSRFNNVIQAKATIFSDADQINLMQDSFSLAFRGLLNYSEPLRYVRSLFNKIPYKYVIWRAFQWHWENLGGLVEYLPDVWPQFQMFAIDRMEAQGLTVDYWSEVYPWEDHEQKLVKSLMFEFLCRMNKSTAIEKVNSFFQSISTSYFEGTVDENPVSVELRSTVYKYYLKNSDDENDWNILYRFYQKIALYQERDRVLRAICSTKNENLLEKLINDSLSSSDPKQIDDFFLIIEYMSGQPVGRRVAWNFYRSNYEILMFRFSSETRRFSSLISSISRTFENESYLQEMRILFEQFPTTGADLVSRERAVEQVQLNIEWIQFRQTSLVLGLASNSF